MKAFILAAGYGTRLKPITLDTPKPCVLFFGYPLLYYILKQIEDAGISEVAINASHLSDKLIATAKQFGFKGNITFFDEGEKPKGTGGAYNDLMPWLDGDSLLAINGDVIADFDMRSFTEYFKGQQEDVIATMGYREIHSSGMIIQNQKFMGTAKAQTREDIKYFALLRLFTADLQKDLLKQPFYGLFDIYKNRANRGKKLLTWDHQGYWFDIGTPKTFYECHFHFLREHLARKQTYHMQCVESFNKRFGRDYKFSQDPKDPSNVLFFDHKNIDCTLTKTIFSRHNNSILFDASTRGSFTSCRSIAYDTSSGLKSDDTLEKKLIYRDSILDVG